MVKEAKQKHDDSNAYLHPRLSRTSLTHTFIIVLAAFAAAWVSLDVMLYTGFI